MIEQESIDETIPYYNASVQESIFTNTSYDEADRTVSYDVITKYFTSTYLTFQNKTIAEINDLIDKAENNELELSDNEEENKNLLVFEKKETEEIYNSYDLSGLPKEVVKYTTIKENGVDDLKYETNISITPIYGYDATGRQTDIITVKYNGFTTNVYDNSDDFISKMWHTMSDAQKDSIVYGCASSIQDKSIAVSFMNNIGYSDGIMSEWIGRNNVFGRVESSFKYLLESAFGSYEIQAGTNLASQLFDKAFKDSLLKIGENKYIDLVNDLTEEQKDAIVTYISNGDYTSDFVIKINNQNYKLNDLTVFSLFNSTSSTIRLSTNYDSLKQMIDYEEFSFSDSGATVNCIFVPMYDLESFKEYAAKWKDVQNEGNYEVSLDVAEKLPNIFVRLTRMENMEYDEYGKLKSWEQDKYDLRVGMKELVKAQDLKKQTGISDENNMVAITNKAVFSSVLEVVEMPVTLQDGSVVTKKIGMQERVATRGWSCYE